MIPRKRTIKDMASAAKRQKVTQPLKPHYGLCNQGATCYLNSVLQVLFMTTEIHDRLNPESQVTDKELRNLFKKQGKKTCGTENITKTFEIKDVHQQRDAAECLEMILNKVSPQASQVFKGELKYSTTCSKGHNINTETNPFLTLPLSLKDDNNSTFNVVSGFDNLFLTKSFIGDNLVYCEQCEKKTEATSECEMLESPHILVLLLKRFDFDYNTMSHFKSHRCVVMPRTLQRKARGSTYKGRAEQATNKMYNLCGIVNHMGGLRGGHYTATILCEEDETWYECNDSDVSKLGEQPFAANAGTYKSSTAYLLVYRDSEGFRDEVEDQQDEQSRDKLEHQRKCGENDVHDRGQRAKQECKGQETKKRTKQACSPETGKEVGNKRVKGSSLNMKITEKDSLLPDDVNTSHSSKPRQDNQRKAKERTHQSNTQEESTRSTNILNDPLCIALIVCGCLLIVILVVILSTLNLS